MFSLGILCNLISVINQFNTITTADVFGACFVPSTNDDGKRKTGMSGFSK